MRISDWSSAVCSSDLPKGDDSLRLGFGGPEHFLLSKPPRLRPLSRHRLLDLPADLPAGALEAVRAGNARCQVVEGDRALRIDDRNAQAPEDLAVRSEEHTSELQSLMRISYAVFCLKKKKNQRTRIITHIT